MAVATSTILAGASIASSLGGAINSFSQAKKQKDIIKESERHADQMMSDARKKLDVNFFENIAINDEAYQREREALLTQGAGVVAAGQEAGVRGVVGTAGRVMDAQQKGQADITDRQSAEMLDLDLKTAEEDSKLNIMKAGLDLKEATGAQQAAADARALRASSIKEGIAGIGSAAQQGLGFVPLFAGSAGAELDALSQMSGVVPGEGGMEFSAGGDADGDGIPDLLDSDSGALGPGGTSSSYGDFFGNMSKRDYRKWKKGISAGDRNKIFGSEFQGLYQEPMSDYNFMNINNTEE